MKTLALLFALLAFYCGQATAAENKARPNIIVILADDMGFSAIAGRAFTLTAKFNTGAARDGVVVAQGGSALGNALFLKNGKLNFIVRNRADTATATPAEITGAHTVTARLDANGLLTLKVDDLPPATAKARGPITARPADGLDVGSDTGGAAGPYTAPNRFPGAIESITLELDAP